MKGILYYMVYSLLWLITLLPLKILYLISDLLYILVYYIAGYRKKTVYTNLRHSLPDLSPEEISRIAKTFYRQLIDYFLEWMYRIHMGEKELSRRMHYKNPEILEQYYAQGKSLVLLFSHYGNWEWTTLMTRLSNHTNLAIYKPLQNKYSDRLFLKLRGKFGVVGVPMNSTIRTIIEYQQNKKPILLYTLADQRPQWNKVKHWTRFLNQDTPVSTGPEKIARRFDMPTLFLSIDKVKRGYYEAEFKVICDEPGEVPDFEITRNYMKIVEKIILKKPELWLWSHKRWKYHRDKDKTAVDIDQIPS